MTVKEASLLFKLDVRKVRDSCKDGYVLDAVKKTVWDIPNDVEVILTKKQIEGVLFCILQFKNSKIIEGYPRCINDKRKALVVFKLLFDLNLIHSGCDDRERFISLIKKWDVEEVIDHIVITKEGMQLIVGHKRLNNLVNVNINVNIEPKFNLGVNIGC